MERHIDGISLPAHPKSVRRARHFVAEAAARAGFEPTAIEIASVAASELVTNAVVHGRGPISVRTVLDPVSLRVEVQDTARLKELQRENAELRRANEILKTASALFATAELDRRLRRSSPRSTSTETGSGSSRSAECSANTTCRSP